MKPHRRLLSSPAILLFTAGISGLSAQEPASAPDQKTPPAAAAAEAPGVSPSGTPATPGAPAAASVALPDPARKGLTPYLGGRRPLNAEEPRPWTAAQATGAPNTPRMGDIATAWAAASPDAGEEWLSAQFTLEADLDRVRVVQSFNPGAITKVTAESSDGRKVELKAETPVPGAGSAASDPVIAEFLAPAGDSLRTTSILITIDERKVPGWNEIDAVEIVARNGARQWAQTAKASSSFGDRYAVANLPLTSLEAAPAPRLLSLEEQVESAQRPLHRSISGLEDRLLRAKQPLDEYGNTHPGSDTAMQKGLPWSPEQATGAPDTPVAGDYPTAWAPLNRNGGKEWLDVTFARPAELGEVRVIESSTTKAITGVHAYMNGVLIPLTLRKEDPAPVTGEAAAPPAPNLSVAPASGSGEQSAASRPRIVTAVAEKTVLPAVQKVRIELDSTGLFTWAEIDAVELVGTDATRQWAAKAEASSTYATGQALPLSTAQGYQRANTLEEANQRIDLLTRRLEQLEREMNVKRNAPGGAPAAGSAPVRR